MWRGSKGENVSSIALATQRQSKVLELGCICVCVSVCGGCASERVKGDEMFVVYIVVGPLQILLKYASWTLQEHGMFTLA